MLIVADIVLFVSLVWPFLAGAVIAVLAPDTRGGHHRDDEEAYSRFPQMAANFSLVSAGLAALNVPLAIFLDTLEGGGVELGWMVEMPLAAVGCLLLHLALVSQCFSPPQPDNSRALVTRDAVPFWTTGLLSLAMLLEEPAARAGMLLAAPVLAVILLDTGAGRAQGGWNTLRRTATGALLVFSGFLHPGLAVEGVLAGLGFCLLAGLSPAGFTASGFFFSQSGNAREMLRCGAATLAVVALFATFPLPDATAFAFRGIVLALGLLTLVLGTMRLRLRDGGGLEAIVQAAFGLAAIAAGVTHPLIADLALLGPFLALPWLGRRETVPDRMKNLAVWGLLLPGFSAALFTALFLADMSPVLALVLIAALWPALRPACRYLPMRRPARKGRV
jgi:hypothetical protein